MTIRIRHIYESVINVLDTVTAAEVLTVLDHANHYSFNALEICARKESLNRIAFQKVVPDCDTLDIEDTFLDLTVPYAVHESKLYRKYDTVWGVGNPMGCLEHNHKLCDRREMQFFMQNLSSLIKPRTGVVVLEITDTLDWSPWYNLDSPDGISVRTTTHDPKDFPPGLQADLAKLGVKKEVVRIDQTATGREFADGYEVKPVYHLTYADGTTEDLVCDHPVLARRYGVREIVEFAQSEFKHVALVQALGRRAVTCFKGGLWVNSSSPTHLVCSNAPLKGALALPKGYKLRRGNNS